MVVQKISLTDIDATDRSCQCRFAGWSHADLKESMGAHGQHEPIHLRGEKPPYTIVDGFRRHAAAVDLEWDAIDAFVHGAMPDMQAKHLAFSSNVARKNLSLLEKINAMYLAEHEYGLSREAQAEVFGVSIRTIDRWHQLCAFPEHIRKIVDCGEITVAHGKHLSDFKVRNAKKWAERIRTEGLTGRGLKNLLARERGPQTGGRPRQLFITKKNKLEVRALTLSLHATPAEKEALIEELMKLIDAIKDSMGEDPDDFGMAELDQE